MWTEERNSRLRALHSEGLSAAQIARALHVEFSMNKTRNSIIGRLHRMGLTGHRGHTYVRPVRPKVYAAPKASKPKKPRYKPEIAPPVLSDEAQRIKAMDPLGPRFRDAAAVCMFIRDEPHRDALVCGRPVKADCLCADHRRLCWRPEPKRVR